MQLDHRYHKAWEKRQQSRKEASQAVAAVAARPATDFVQALPPLSLDTAGDGDGSCTACTLAASDVVDKEVADTVRILRMFGEIRRSEL